MLLLAELLAPRPPDAASSGLIACTFSSLQSYLVPVRTASPNSIRASILAPSIFWVLCRRPWCPQIPDGGFGGA